MSLSLHRLVQKDQEVVTSGFYIRTMNIIVCFYQKKKKKNILDILRVKEIWLMLLHTIGGQYEAITGEPEVVIRKQQQFWEIWKKVRSSPLSVREYSGDMLHQDAFFLPPSWNDPTWGLLILVMLVDVGMRVTIYCMNSL